MIASKFLFLFVTNRESWLKRNDFTLEMLHLIEFSTADIGITTNFSHMVQVTELMTSNSVELAQEPY